MSINADREAFEEQFPVPENVRWNPDFCGQGRYEPDNALLNPEAADDAFLHHQRWIGWQAGRNQKPAIPADWIQMGVGSGTGQLFVYGPYEAIKACQARLVADENRVPNENGKNRYGLDMAYFRRLINRELNRPLVDFRPDELARVLARAARTADATVLQEPEFIQQAESGEALEPQVMGRVSHLDDGSVVCHLNSIGRALPDHTPLYAHSPTKPESAGRPYEYALMLLNQLGQKLDECFGYGDEDIEALLDEWRAFDPQRLTPSTEQEGN